VTLNAADLRGAEMRRTNLTDAKMEGTNLNYATLCGTILPDGEITVRDC
jgi:uncharacterized protein YjbI with pentapeptide repeats